MAKNPKKKTCKDIKVILELAILLATLIKLL